MKNRCYEFWHSAFSMTYIVDNRSNPDFFTPPPPRPMRTAHLECGREAAALTARSAGRKPGATRTAAVAARGLRPASAPEGRRAVAHGASEVARTCFPMSAVLPATPTKSRGPWEACPRYEFTYRVSADEAVEGRSPERGWVESRCGAVGGGSRRRNRAVGPSVSQ
jgi:hypothetical protein